MRLIDNPIQGRFFRWVRIKPNHGAEKQDIRTDMSGSESSTNLSKNREIATNKYTVYCYLVVLGLLFVVGGALTLGTLAATADDAGPMNKLDRYHLHQ